LAQEPDKRSNRTLINLVIIVLIVGAIVLTARHYFSLCDALDCPNVATFVRSLGPWSPLVYAALYIVSSPVPFLATVLSATGGFLFGPFWGTVYVIALATVSALVPFSLARRMGRDWVESRLRGKRLGQIYQQTGDSNGFVFIMIMRLVPVLPWEVQNYAAGLTDVPAPTFVGATMLGIIPGVFLNTFLGASVTDPNSWQFRTALALYGVMILISVTVIAARRRRIREGSAPQS
jgi:uncharacterized membrane protein YdjX (TVP38/TMEM64 family)